MLSYIQYTCKSKIILQIISKKCKIFFVEIKYFEHKSKIIASILLPLHNTTIFLTL